MTQETATQEWTVLARLLRPQGRRGEILSEILTDFPDRFAHTGPVTLLPPEDRPVRSRLEPKQSQILAHWFPVGRNAGRVVLELAGVENINAAEDLAGWSVALPISERLELTGDSVYISDLIGCTLFNGESNETATIVGHIDDVEFPAPELGGATGPDAAVHDAPALLVVKEANANDIDATEHLIPFVKAWIVQMDTAAKRIVMHLPDGLLEINAAKNQASEIEIDEA